LSRLSSLVRQVDSFDPQLGLDLRREVEALSTRRAFGLNFERHIPETVDLPGRPIRRGDKVRFLPKRGEKVSSVNQKLWRVRGIRSTASGQVADLVRRDRPENQHQSADRAVGDLVVVAEFRDPIYPSLVSTGKVHRGGDKPFHTVINAENFHALQLLLYTHEGRIDAIYIDPPYNTGARDWKYNNDYVDSDDAYRHSKWLAMMERRLKLAKRLLNPESSVLIVTIDEKEHLRLGLDFDPDPGAVVLWFTDDPSLNEQTRFRLLAAADRIPHSHLVVIENTFNQEKLEPGKVYFLNSQKLGKNSLLLRGARESSGERAQYDMPMPDARAFTMWDTLANTIADKSLCLYLILDEAHRGMKARTRGDRAEKATIVQRLVNGANGVPPVPIVWGISATVERFNKAMAEAENRTNYASVVVNPARVQESGLLKDDIRIDFPVETGQFDTVLLARATRKAKRSTEQWRRYAQIESNLAQAVIPLLVVQVPNTPSDELLLSAFTTIREAWPELEPDSMAHVFGDHAPVEIGSFTVPHVRPEAVQDRRHIRVLFAKDAISTGWDCPRAEVLVSFRPARDETHITQLLGRMVRTPLARRIPGNDLLNSVECLLPHFDRSTAAKVAEAMLGEREQDLDGTGGGAGRRVLLAPIDMEVNQTISEAVWEAFDALPSQTLPRRAARPIGRLAALAQALARDGLRPGALNAAYQRLFAKLDGLAIQYQEQVRTAMTEILEVSGETVVVKVVGGEVAEGGGFVESADYRSVDADFKAARRILTPDLARRYADHIAVESQDDDGIFDARVKVAALAQVDGVPSDLDGGADELAQEWFTQYRVDIKGLTDERRDVYETIKSLSPEPQVTEIQRPRVRAEETEDADGNKLGPVHTSRRFHVSSVASS